MADTAYMQYEDESGVIARWHGGEYIEIGNLEIGVCVDGVADFVAQDVINVWDYEAGKPRIPVTLDAFSERVHDYFDEMAEREAE